MFNPLGDPARPSAGTTLVDLQFTANFTYVSTAATMPWTYVNILAFLFGNRQFSDNSIKSNLYIQTTDQVNSKPLAFYKFGATNGYTTANYSYGIGDATVVYYDGVD